MPKSDRIVTADTNGNLPAEVRAKLAANIVDPATVEGAAILTVVPPGGASTPSTDAGNLLTLGTDSLLMLDPADLPAGAGIPVQDTPPTAVLDATWWDKVTGQLKRYDGTEWVPVGEPPAGIGNVSLQALALGRVSVVGGASSVAIGNGAQATHANAMAIGAGAATTQDYEANIKANVLRIAPAAPLSTETGINLESADGSHWLITVSNAGTLIITASA